MDMESGGREGESEWRQSCVVYMWKLLERWGYVRKEKREEGRGMADGVQRQSLVCDGEQEKEEMCVRDLIK